MAICWQRHGDIATVKSPIRNNRQHYSSSIHKTAQSEWPFFKIRNSLGTRWFAVNPWPYFVPITCDAADGRRNSPFTTEYNLRMESNQNVESPPGTVFSCFRQALSCVNTLPYLLVQQRFFSPVVWFSAGHFVQMYIHSTVLPMWWLVTDHGHTRWMQCWVVTCYK